MKVVKLGSATVIIKTNDVNILCDPWLTDGIYYGSWCNYPPINLDDCDFNDIDYVYISHVHPDHFDPKTMDLLSKKIPVLIHKYHQKFLKANIERLGFNVIELDNAIPFQLSETTKLSIYAADNCDFIPDDHRTDGTYGKYSSIDDKIDGLHFYTRYIKFGLGRATYDVSQELRNDHLNVDEGKKLIKKYDGEFPNIYFNEIMEYLDIKPKNFFKNLDKFRSPHLWRKIKGEWKLRHTVNRDGTDD